MAVKIQIVILRIMKQNNLVGGYQRSEGDFVAIYKTEPPSKPRRLQSHSVPYFPENSHVEYGTKRYRETCFRKMVKLRERLQNDSAMHVSRVLSSQYARNILNEKIMQP
jgi:hypothetical protein